MVSNMLSVGMSKVDCRKRRLRDLRISVIDRCNFRCVYCMPKKVFGRDYPFLSRTDVLSFEEIVRVARAAVALGVERIRLTGGEPLLRRGLEKLVEQLAKLPVELALTTNGTLLKEKARSLKDAGLQRVTVSLDAIDPVVFGRMTDATCPVGVVLDGIEAAAVAGFAPIKINCVLKRCSNSDQILPLARHFRGSGHVLRFIEYMDAGNANPWRMDEVITASEIVEIVDAEYPLEPLDANHHSEVAKRWRYCDGAGEIGVIASVTQAFCADCSRLRLSTDGKLYTCLFAETGHDVRALLRLGADDSAVTQAISRVWQGREDRYSEIRHFANYPARKIEMSYIGG